MRYRAFISYSHADEKWARWLLKRLESYRVPANLVGTPGRDGPIPAKLGQMFRDRDELPSAGDLSSTISAALVDSDALIVICSPASARSRWVNAEVQAFRNSGRGERIFSFITGGDPASREPGIASFPPALIEPETPGGPEREPLAADARKEGDGRERAFLKVVAGLLGVGFNDLAQREAQQRHRRMAFITAASLAGMAIAVALAVTAYIARNDAERRQAQAEDILGFMLGDLRKNLTKVGRLDLMRSVDDKATGYFATLNPRDLSDRTLEEQARSLTGIGEVRLNEGNHEEAMKAFREAHARSTALYERAPKNGQRLFDLAQAEYWIGFVAWQQGRFDEAGVWLTKYKDSGVKLAAMDRKNAAWQQEEIYGYQNLAVLDESLGNYESAKKAMLAIRAVYAKWLSERPNDYALRFEDSDKASWLGSLALQSGNLKLAEYYFDEQSKAIAKIDVQDPTNIKWKQYRMTALQLLLDVQIKQGKYELARNTNNTAILLAKELVNQDPKNIHWTKALGISSYWSAVLAESDKAKPIAQTLDILGKVHSVEPESESNARWMAKAYALQAHQLLKSGNHAGALNLTQDAHELIAFFWSSKPNEQVRLSKAQLHILEGEILIQAGRRVEGEIALNRAFALLTEKSSNELPFSRLDDLVRTLRLLGHKNKARDHEARLIAAGFIPLRPYP
jgi:eukaryotic-like serine/threonine-protein kinase